MPFQGQPATASERKWNDSWWGYIKRCEPLPKEKQVAVAKQKQAAESRSEAQQLRFIIMKSSRAFDGATAEWAYRGPTCKNAGVTPGKVYLDFDAANADAALLTKHNPVGFVVLPLLPEDGDAPEI